MSERAVRVSHASRLRASRFGAQGGAGRANGAERAAESERSGVSVAGPRGPRHQEKAPASERAGESGGAKSPGE